MEFDWDEGNIDKNLRDHGVTTDEIEEALVDRHAKGDSAHRIGTERRKAVLGRTLDGRYLRIVYTERVRTGRIIVSPISARDMTPVERARYLR